MKRSLLFALLLLSLPLIGLGMGERAQAWQVSGNLLQNPGFEGDFFAWSGINEVQVAHGWTPWWRTRTDADPAAFYFQPEYKKANGYIYPNRVHGGASAQQWFTFHATHQAGMYQQVFNVIPGTRYRFSAWAQVWSSNDDDPNVSVSPAYPNLKVGIDPTGQWNPWSGAVVWSGSHAYYDSWGPLAVEAVAQGSVITVFLRSDSNFPVKHNDMYWDDAALEVVGAGPAPVPPSATPAGPPPPTYTPAGPPAPTATCVPAPANWVRYIVQRGDTLYSLSKRSGTTLDMVIAVNCLSSTTIHVGQALLLPRLPATATPLPPTRTPAPVIPSATRKPTATASATATPAATATPTEVPATPSATSRPATATALATATATTAPPTAVSATATDVPVAAVTATPTKAPPTIPPATSTPSGGSTRPCGTVVVGAGMVLVAGVFRLRRRG